jgi:hypothetical protein
MTVETSSVIGKLLMTLPANGLVSLVIHMTNKSNLCMSDPVLKSFTFASMLFTLKFKSFSYILFLGFSETYLICS